MTQGSRVQPKQARWWGMIGGILLATFPSMALAQVVGDGTLGTQVNGSLTAPCTGDCIITNGATRGRNLFHSFQQFSLPNGDFAGFVTTPTIQNVIVRVTGVGQPFISNINGTIATVNAAVTDINPANFFLLNPNGIVFGPGARVLIGGSFLATTASRMQFADGTEFRTNEPAPLLTVSVPTGLQFNAAPSTIQANGFRLLAGQTDSFGDFSLVGGDVTLDGSSILAPGRRVELEGVGGNGMVGLRLNGDRLSSSLSADTLRRDITLTNRSRVTTSATQGGGAVLVMGRNIVVLGGSAIFTEILPGIDNAATNQAGDITINAAVNLQLTQTSVISNLVRPDAVGQGGNTNITAADIHMNDGSAIISSTSGEGNAGNIGVTANTIALDTRSGIFAIQGSDTGSGRSGDITIQTGLLTVTNGAEVSASTLGNGAAGNVQVTANTIALDSVGGIFSQNFGTVSGRGGDVTVSTGSLTVTNGALISAGTSGSGDAGSVRVIANTIALDGTTSNGQFSSGIFSQVSDTGSGRGGNVTVTTGSLTVTNGASISAGTFGNGDGGNVQVTANIITLDGSTPNGLSGSGIGSGVGLTGSGQGGDVTVATGSLTMTNGASISAGTSGNGDGGNVQVTANTITLDGTIPDSQFATAITSEVSNTGNGQGGDVTVATGLLTATNGARVSASTFGNGNGGNARVTANTIALDGTTPDGRSGSGIGSEVGRTGNGQGGDVSVLTNLFTVTNGAGVSSSALGNGSAGNLDITAHTLRLDRGTIIAAAVSGNGANINLSLGNLLLMRNGSRISTSAGLAGAGGNGGNITINAANGFLVTALRENNDITANAFNGSGGRVTISTQGIFGFIPRSRAELVQLLGTNDPAQLDPRRLPTNDITAISQGNPDLSGTVTLNVLNLDPSRGLVTLPLNLTDPAQKITQSCTPGSKTAGSSFVATGRGGIPLNPDEPLESRAVVTKWVALPKGVGEQGSEGVRERGRIHPEKSEIPAPIVEAQGWIVRPDGMVELVAEVPTGSAANFSIATAPCPVPPSP